MIDKPRVAAIEGWYTLDTRATELIGSRCAACGSYYFPRLESSCRNPGCTGGEVDTLPLSRHGTLWSYTSAGYPPPPPFVAPEPFVPYAIAAVELAAERMVILGQVASGVSVDALRLGMPMELVLEPLYEDEENIRMIWKWQPREDLS